MWLARQTFSRISMKKACTPSDSRPTFLLHFRHQKIDKFYVSRIGCIIQKRSKTSIVTQASNRVANPVLTLN